MRTPLLVALAAVIPAALAAQAPPGSCTHRGTAADLAKRPSPLDSVEATMDGGTVKVCYGRPSARGRTMVGGVNPFGEPWRLGANEPTRLMLPFAAEVAGVRVEPGTYSLYVVPSQASWEVHVNRVVDRWGIPIDAQVEAQDVGKGTVPVETLAQPIEELTMRLETGPDAALVVEWEKTRVRIPIRKAG
jgi:DUF2911 family protein